jgi:hypothetical protein
VQPVRGKRETFRLRAEDGDLHGKHLLSDFWQRKSAGGFSANAGVFFLVISSRYGFSMLIGNNSALLGTYFNSL